MLQTGELLQKKIQFPLPDFPITASESLGGLRSASVGAKQTSSDPLCEAQTLMNRYRQT
jgi:hypothetical protein